MISRGDFGLKVCQIFAHCPPYRHLNSDYMVLLEVIAGKRPARPPRREVLGLEDSVWNMMQECWGSDPQTRPAIKDVRSFLGSASSKWSPPTSEEIRGLDLDSLEVNIDTTAADSTCMCPNVECYDAH